MRVHVLLARLGVVALALAVGACTPQRDHVPVTEETRSPPSTRDATPTTSAGSAASGSDSAAAEQSESREADTEPRTRVALLEPTVQASEIELRKSELAGAADDPLPATEAGYYMDIQEANLRQHIDGDEPRLMRLGQTIVIFMAGIRGFETGEAALDATMTSVFDDVVRVVAEYPMTFISVHAHTDATGPQDYNKRLAERRALAVAGYLVEGGVEPQRVVAVGHGEPPPDAPRMSTGRDLPSRHIQIWLQPITRALGGGG